MAVKSQKKSAASKRAAATKDLAVKKTTAAKVKAGGINLGPESYQP